MGFNQTPYQNLMNWPPETVGERVAHGAPGEPVVPLEDSSFDPKGEGSDLAPMDLTIPFVYEFDTITGAPLSDSEILQLQYEAGQISAAEVACNGIGAALDSRL